MKLLPNRYVIHCGCGQDGCIEKTGKLGPGCILSGGLWLPAHLLNRVKHRVPSERISLEKACREHIEDITSREQFPTLVERMAMIK